MHSQVEKHSCIVQINKTNCAKVALQQYKAAEKYGRIINKTLEEKIMFFLHHTQGI